MVPEYGSLSAAMSSLICAVLPLDISVADEHDVLVYWKGEGYRNCDPAYIGRDLRDCHSSSTMAVLEEILRAFKAGEKDLAEAWRRKPDGRMKRLRYYALRDADGNYRGILEINEDLTEARALEGEQALPGW